MNDNRLVANRAACSASIPTDTEAMRRSTRRAETPEPIMDVDTPISAHPRHKQMFPVLTEAEIDRIGRFSAIRSDKRGTRLVAAGQQGPGMFVVLKGAVTIIQRDGLGRVTPILALQRR